MKKQFILAGMVAMSLAVSACGAKDNNNGDNNSQVESDGGNVAQTPEEIQTSLGEIRDAVATAYGDDYIPSMPYDETTVKELFGVDPSWYDAIVAEGPMISTHVDTFIAIHPTEGNLENVETALNDYKDKLVNESMQYPMNMEKVKAATITTIGDNVYFIMLGFIDDTIEDEAKRLEAFTEKNQIAVDAINEYVAK